jgi:glycine/sarcosine N-methyltransferase
MTFYQALAPYYDHIFPDSSKQSQFLSTHLQPGSALLDLGAGTGSVACSLAQSGYTLTAAEPDPAMSAELRTRMQQDGIELTVTTHSMQQIGELEGTFEGIYCIGNTLAHLDNEEEVTALINQLYNKLKDQGQLIIQVVNFEKVLIQQGAFFPLIQFDGYTFIREYELKNDRVWFTSTLEHPEHMYSNTIPLYPVTETLLVAELEKSGFRSLILYGDYNRTPYSRDSAALVIVAVK